MIVSFCESMWSALSRSWVHPVSVAGISQVQRPARADRRVVVMLPPVYNSTRTRITAFTRQYRGDGTTQ